MGIIHTEELTDAAKERLNKSITVHIKEFGVEPKVSRHETLEMFVEEIDAAIDAGIPFVSDAAEAEELGHEILL